MTNFIGTLIIAFFGAALGAFFAIYKSKKERLWLDRYETLRDITISLGTVESAFSSSHMEQLGVSVMGREERKRVTDEWPVAMHTLRQNLAKLRLLFKDSKISDLRAAVVELHSAFTDMYHGDQIHMPDLHEAISARAAIATEAAIAVGQRHCL